MNHRQLLLAIVFLFSPLFAAAQTPLATSDVTVWITDSEFNDPTISDGEETATLEFEEEFGYGLSFNHFWTPSISTEFAFHKIGAQMSVSLDGGPDFEAGEIDATALTGVAQWHFRRATRFSPYVGGGVAFMQGDFSPIDEDETFDFESETTWVANFGANIGLTERLAIALDARFINWEPKEENDEALERVDVSPVLLSAGLRFRF